MADVVSNNVPKGTDVKWYGGGEVGQKTITVTAAMVTAGGFSLGTLVVAEYGSTWGEVNGIKSALIEYDDDKNTPATETTGTNFVGYTGIKEGDIVDVYFVDIHTAGLTHISTCKDVKDDNKASSKKESVHGQTTQLVTVGTVATTANIEALMYTIEFVGLVFGDTVTGSPAPDWTKWSNKSRGFKKIGVLVGKRRNAAGEVIDKYFLIGALANSLGQTFPTEELYKESFAFDCDYVQRARKNTT